MPALAGVLSRVPGAKSEVVERMLAAAPHRGAHREIGSLGHFTVGVSDEDGPREASLAEGDGLIVAFAGTLDNAHDLAKQSGPSNGSKPDPSPSELVLGLFKTMRETVPTVLRGNFSCLISDGQHLWAFRDHVGFETLFHRQDGTGVYVATEAKQVLAGASLTPEPDLEIVEAMFYGDVEDATACPLRGVVRLLGGTLLAGDVDSLSTRRYWDPTRLLETASLSQDEVAEHFRELFAQAVRRTLTGSDVVALSGGVDSPPIAAIGNQQHVQLFGRPMPALAEVYPSHPSADERQYIELVADRLRIPLHTYEPGPQRLDRLQYWVRLFDGPWSTVGPEGTAERCRQARSLGYRTLLTGHFAEHVTAAGQWLLVPHLIWRGRFRAAARQLASQRQAGVRSRRLSRQVLGAFVPRIVQGRRLSQRPQIPMPPWIDGGRIAKRDERAALPARRRWISFQLPIFGGGTSAEADLYTHAVHGIRPRRPWADVDLWEFFISLPAEIKFPDYRMKGFARTVLREHVPDEILDRRDKTNTNEYFRSMCLDYPALRRWLREPDYRVAGVDYTLLAEELEKENMSLAHYLWAKDLAAVHAFLGVGEKPS